MPFVDEVSEVCGLKKLPGSEHTNFRKRQVIFDIAES
jgi:hypothetical protein